MGQLQDEETPIDREIVTELIELTPSSWQQATLEVTYSSDGTVERYAHAISSPEGRREIIDVSEKLFDATYRLGALFRRHGRHWKRVTYAVRLSDNGDYDYTVDFGY